MAAGMGLELGSEITCSDGACGKLERLVVDPAARTVTYLVVEPPHRVGMARLVPIRFTDRTAHGVRLSCTLAEFDRFDAAEFLAVTEPGFAGEGLPSWPFGSDTGDPGIPAGFGGNATPPVVFDRVPEGDVEVCRGDAVQATDGPIGRVQGLVLDPGNSLVTHVLLQEGHLWGRKEVAVPVAAVTSVTDGIQLNVTKVEVQNLLSVDLDDGLF
jgi:sporulation protein YlmC with PRC-barrel domain